MQYAPDQGKKPSAIDGNIVVYVKCYVRHYNFDVPVFNIAGGPRNGHNEYCEFFGEVCGTVLQANDALELYKGDYINRTLISKNNHEYRASVFSEGVKEKVFVKEDGTSAKKQVLDIKIVPHAINKDGEIYGYQVNGVLVHKSAGHNNNTVKLSPIDAYNLINHPDIKLFIGENCVTLSGIDEKSANNGKTYKIARLNVEKKLSFKGEENHEFELFRGYEIPQEPHFVSEEDSGMKI